jgi:type IV pilus assembly protein PilO
VAIETGLEGKPWYYGLIVGLVVAGLVFGLTHYLLLGPMKEEIAGLESRLDELHTKIQEGRSAQARLPQFREQVRRLELELDKLLRILPARLNTQEILRNVRVLAERGDFDLKVFEPGQLVDRDFYKEWPIKITLDGRYHNLAKFFDEIRRYPRIFNIENLQLQALQDQRGAHTLSTSFTAKTFVYSDSPPEAVAAGAGGAPAPPPGGVP